MSLEQLKFPSDHCTHPKVRKNRIFPGVRRSCPLGIAIIFALFSATADAQAQAPLPVPPTTEQPKETTAPKNEPPTQCFQPTDSVTEVRRFGPDSGKPIFIDTPFLNTGTAIEIGLDEPYKDGQYFFAALVNSSDATERSILNAKSIASRPSQLSDALVQKDFLATGKVILRMTFPDGVSSFWQAADLYVYRCNGSPKSVSHLNVRVSALSWSTAATWIFIFAAYLLAALAFGRMRAEGVWRLSVFNPIKLTAGADGRGSLSTLQIFFFSLIVFGLTMFFLLRTGKLSDLSTTVLLLLGITGFGSTAAKGIDAQRSALYSENAAWLSGKDSLPDTKEASWTDLLTTDGMFDVYRYQTLIFSLAVGGALVATGVSELSSFTIPGTLLGILGLSQAVYIGGKMVTPTEMSGLNKALNNLRALEAEFRADVLKQNAAFSGTLQEAQNIAPSAFAKVADKVSEIKKMFDVDIRLDPNSRF